MARKWARGAAWVALLIFTLSCEKGASDLPLESSQGDPEDATIQGEVMVGDAGLAGVELALTGPESGTATTDDRGAFGFTNLKRGTYTLVLRGFDPARHSFPTTQQTVSAVDGNPVEADFIGALVPQPPAAPSGLQAAAAGPGAVDLTWTDGSDNEARFLVERRPGDGGGWSEVGVSGADTARFADTGLSPVTTYAYRVRACNDAGCSAYTAEASATTEAVPPAAPMSLSAMADGPSAILLSWTDASNNETGFQVERRAMADSTWVQAGAPGADTAVFTDSGLAPNTSYSYRVRACNDAGCSSYSDEAAATTTEVAGGPNLVISNLYLTQSTQTLGGDVPLVADKAGYLRVFVVADEDNGLRPDVRVRFYLGGGLVHTETIPAPGPSVPREVYESSIGYSWNVDVPPSMIRPGLAILAEVDPGNRIPERDETDNHFPSGGSPMGMQVVVIPTFGVTFVPVRQSANGLVGNVTAGNAGSFLDVTMEMLPIADFDAAVHAVYVTDAEAVESSNANGAWGTILSEIYALRAAEGGDGHYFGVLKTSYTSGVAGMGYLGFPTAIGWDRLPSASAVAAHEWGHNWNRYHAPGCGVANPDPEFPYADGKIGTWGLNVETESLKSPSTHFDFMSYCGPDWISDYNYEAILEFRNAEAVWATSDAAEPSLLVWGRVEGDRIFLEPAFRLTTRPVLPSGGGDYVLEAFGEDGTPLLSLAFQPNPVPDGLPGEGHFAFAIPVRAFDESRLAGLRVWGGGRAPGLLESRMGPAAVVAAEKGIEVTRVEGAAVEVDWDAGTFPMAVVRDAESGEILSFARGGSVRLPDSSREVDVILSDGIRSSRPVRKVVR